MMRVNKAPFLFNRLIPRIYLHRVGGLCIEWRKYQIMFK